MTFIHDELAEGPIVELYVFLAEHMEGEGIVGASTADGMFPLVASRAEVAEKMKEVAAKLGRLAQKRVKLVRFTTREEIWQVDAPEMQATRHAPQACEACGYVFDAAGRAEGEHREPVEDDLSICLNCGAAMQLKSGRWRAMTPEEIVALEPEARTALFKAQKAQREMKEKHPERRKKP